MFADIIEAKNQRLAKEREAEDALDAKILEASMQQKKSDAAELIRQKAFRRNAQLTYMRHLQEQVRNLGICVVIVRRTLAVEFFCYYLFFCSICTVQDADFYSVDCVCVFLALASMLGA